MDLCKKIWFTGVILLILSAATVKSAASQTSPDVVEERVTSPVIEQIVIPVGTLMVGEPVDIEVTVFDDSGFSASENDVMNLYWWYNTMPADSTLLRDTIVLNSIARVTDTFTIPAGTLNEAGTISFAIEVLDLSQLSPYEVRTKSTWNSATWLGNVGTNIIDVIHCGGVCPSSFVLVSSNGNQAPVVVAPIPDQSFFITDAPVVIADLNTVFSDPDMDPLTFEFSETTFIQLDSAGTQLSIAPLAVGTESVSITATDGLGSTVTDIFNVEVKSSADPCTISIANPAGDQSLKKGDASMLDAGVIFAISDNCSPEFTAASSDESIATVANEGPIYTFTALDTGMVTISLTALDGDVSATESFTLTVTEDQGNVCTIAVANATGNQALLKGGTVEFDADAIFAISDDCSPEYAATTSDASIATVENTGAIFTITARDTGQVTIDFMAFDGAVSASDVFTLTVTEDLSDVCTITVANPAVDQSLQKGATATLNAGDIFAISDNCTPAYTATSADESIATVTTTGSIYTITAQNTGPVTINLTASDGLVSATDSFQLTVVEDPAACMIAVARRVGNLTVRKGAPFTLNPDAIFSVTGNCVPTYEAVSLNETVVSVTTDQALYTLTPMETGSAFIKLTALDTISGAAATDSFNVVVLPIDANLPPVVQPVPFPETLTIGGSVYTLPLDSLFVDPDGDPMVFTVESNNPSIALASITSASSVVVTPLVAGDAVITVTASDAINDPVPVEISFVINTFPFSEPFEDVVLTIGDTLVIALNEKFGDPDGDVLTYSAEADQIAQTRIDGNLLTVTLDLDEEQPARVETTPLITIWADDGNAAINRSFYVEINTRPTVIASLPDTSFQLPNLRQLRAQAFSIDLTDIDASSVASPVFKDLEDALRFSVETEDPTIVAAELVDEHNLLITPLSFQLNENEPRIQITVRAFDDRGGEAEVTFGVGTSQTEVSQSLSTLLSGESRQFQPVFIEAKIDQAAQLEPPVIYFRRGGDPGFASNNMRLMDDGSGFAFDIPGPAVSDRGIEYSIEAINIFDQSEKISGSVNVQIPNLNATALPPGQLSLISMPLELNATKAIEILKDDLGENRKNRWRLFEPDMSAEACEIQSVNFKEASADDDITIRPGHGYWLISKNATPIDTGSGKTIPIDVPFQVSLQQGWNLVGNPFTFRIPVANVSFSSGADVELYGYNDGWLDPDSTTGLEPFAGYAICAAEEDVLEIDPRIFPKAPDADESNQKESDVAWAINISASSPHGNDLKNVASVLKAEAPEANQTNKPEPPWMGDFVSVYFPNAREQRRASRYRTDARSAPVDGVVWDFEVLSTTSELVSLTFEGLDDVPEEFDIWLIDEVAKVSKNLRDKPDYGVAGTSITSPRRLKLVVGDAAYQEELLGSLDLLPDTYALLQNFPNPFTTSTTIPFSLPEPEAVSIAVYDLLGKRVTTLMNGQDTKAGHHVALWDGRNAAGQSVASGVYFIRFKAGSFTHTRKTMLLK